MKCNVFWTVLAATALFAGCEKEPEKEPIPAPDQAYFSSFGFEAKEGVFANAVSIESPEEGTISFQTPIGTESSAYTDLVPVFELTDENATVTNVDGEEVESGKAYDFSKDVDLYVTVKNEGGEKTTMYTISVKAKAALMWSLASEATDSLNGDVNMGINPYDGVPYLVARMNSKAGYQGVAYKFEETLKPAIGNSSIFYGHQIDNPGVGFDEKGGVYVAFRGYTGAGGASIVKLEASGAKHLGDSVAFLPYIDEVPVVWGDESKLWVAYRAGRGSTAIDRRLLQLAMWNGSSWTTEQTISTERPADAYAYFTVSNYAYGKKYMLTFNQNYGTVSVYKLENGTWSAVVDNLQFKKPDGTVMEGNKSIYSSYRIDFDVASNGDIYICAGCPFVSDEYNIGVVRYRPSDQSQTIVGGVTNRLINKDRYFSIALDSNDTPYMAFRNNVDGDNKLFVQYIDNKTKTWTTPVAISANAVGAPTIRFNENGDAYIAVTNDDNQRVQIYTAK